MASSPLLFVFVSIMRCVSAAGVRGSCTQRTLCMRAEFVSSSLSLFLAFYFGFFTTKPTRATKTYILLRGFCYSFGGMMILFLFDGIRRLFLFQRREVEGFRELGNVRL